MRLPEKRRLHRRLSAAQRDALIGAYAGLVTEAWVAAMQTRPASARLLAERTRDLIAAFTTPVPRRRSA